MIEFYKVSDFSIKDLIMSRLPHLLLDIYVSFTMRRKDLIYKLDLIPKHLFFHIKILFFSSKKQSFLKFQFWYHGPIVMRLSTQQAIFRKNFLQVSQRCFLLAAEFVSTFIT